MKMNETRNSNNNNNNKKNTLNGNIKHARVHRGWAAQATFLYVMP